MELVNKTTSSILAKIDSIISKVSATNKKDENDTEYPFLFNEKIDFFPDLRQQNALFPNGGKYFCAPTTFANILIFLKNTGFEELVNTDPVHLVEELATLMNTTGEGTDPLSCLMGLKKYVHSRKHSIKIAEFQGWRNTGRYRVSEHIDEQFILDGVKGPFNCVLNIGRYQYSITDDSYTRISGHFVTVVGYEKKSPTEIIILVLDPLSKKKEKVVRRLQLVKIYSGIVHQWKRYPPRKAAGSFMVKYEDQQYRKSTPKQPEIYLLDTVFRFVISMEYNEESPATTPKLEGQ
jgi:hypothetical protein